jgi:DegV family protein with EDD domain
MQKPVIITADSSADLPEGIRREFGIHFLPLYVQVEDKTGRDCVDIFPQEIYDAFAARGSLPKTAAASIGEYKDFFTQFTSQGAAVVHVALSSKYSSCYHVATIAAEETQGEVHVVDSHHFCTGQGMLAIQGARLRDGGLPAQDIARQLLQDRARVRAYYYLDGLTFLSKSGRCPTLVAMGATLFILHPSVTFKGDPGALVIGKKYRGNSAAASEQWLRDVVQKFSVEGDTDLCFFMHTPELAPAQYEPMDRIAAQGLAGARRLITDTIGCLIISHVGGNCYALVGMQKQ